MSDKALTLDDRRIEVLGCLGKIGLKCDEKLEALGLPLLIIPLGVGCNAVRDRAVFRTGISRFEDHSDREPA